MRLRGKIVILLIFLFTYSSFLHAAIKAKHSFETQVPRFVSVKGNANISISPEKFKDGNHSLKYAWNGESELVFSNFTEIEASMKVNSAGIIVWIYNTKAMSEPLRFSFVDWQGVEICYFDFNADFVGWRTAWIKYADMLCPIGSTSSSDLSVSLESELSIKKRYYGDKPLKDRNTMVAKMLIKPSANIPEGTIYIDRLSFSSGKLHDQITPDKQIPDNNNHLKRNMWQWCRLWEWEQYPQLSRPIINSTQEQMLRLVEKRMDEWVLVGVPSAQYTANTLIPRADSSYEKYGIKRLADGSVIGAPLLSDDEFVNAEGEMRIRFIQEICFWYALDYAYTGNLKNIDKVINTLDHAINQGFAYGSGQGTNHHYGYQVRDLYKAVWILRHELEKRGKLDEYVKTLTYWSALAEVRKDLEVHRDEILDTWHTLHNCKVISAMLQKDDAMKYAYMKRLGEWTSATMLYTDGTLGGLKIDGTSFHHGGHYPAYSVGAFAALGDFCYFTKDTDFVIDAQARKCFKHALLALLDYTNITDWGFGVSGRHPFNGNIPNADIQAYARLAVLEDTLDRDLAAAYIYLGGKNKEYLSSFKKAGVQSYIPKEGFRVYNYGAFGIHRRANWMITLKAYNSDVWSSEIYAADNRFGRYLSYGTVQLMERESAKASGYSGEGWDWNRFPGATSVHLPFEILDSPNKGTLMERNDARFPGVSSLEGKNGCMAFTYTEKDRVNFSAGATATKSVFCFDNRIIHIGTGISNNSIYPTETTLYQLLLNDKADEIDINDEFTDAFPYSKTFEIDAPVLLSDNKDNFYIIKSGNSLVVEKKHQVSPSDTKKKIQEGDYVSAYLNHGVSPSNASYEYMLLVQPSNKEVSKYMKKSPYEIIQADNAAHVVRDIPTGVFACISYKGYSSETDLLSKVDKETIVMYSLKNPAQKGGEYIMSICTPDLGITQKGYTTSQSSQIIKKRIELNGKFKLQDSYTNVRIISSESNKTILEADCVHGIPVEFIILNH